MLQTLMIAFREGLEALLVVAIAWVYLQRTGRTALHSALSAGVLTALALSAALGVVLAQIGALSTVWAGVMALIAAVAVMYCTVHMWRMGRHMKTEIDTGLGAALDKSPRAAWWSVFAFAIFMVGREGMETATMIASLAIHSEGWAMTLGGVIGLALAMVVAWLWKRHGHKVNLKRFFNVTAVFMAVFSVQLIVYAFHEFTEAGAFPGIDNAYWHIATEPYAEGIVAQIVTIAMVVLPTAWLAGAFWLDRQKQMQTPARVTPAA